ncbi:L,D-transpeptidase [Pseudorhodoplanes sp.]|uniref:L,D-transpeptidase n=1 Tax=Pseudorhodoplanes sp. TaxID=1934341 RepID=UPI003D143DF2
MRRLVLVSSLAAFGFAIAEPSNAQYTDPRGYRGNGVIAVEPDEDDGRILPPGPAARGSYDPAIDRQTLPPLPGGEAASQPYDAYPRAAAPGDILPPPPDRDFANRAPRYGTMGPQHEPPYYAPPPGGYAPPPGGYASPAAPYGAPPPYAAPPPAAYGAPPAAPYGAHPDDLRQAPPRPPGAIEAGRGYPGTTGSIPPRTIAALPPEDQPEVGKPKELPPQFKRQVVDYRTKHPAGTIIIDTPSTFLYYVNGDGTAIRYGIGVGRDGFTWAGTEKVTRMAEWPDWHPPAEMIERQPYLPRFMAGGESNPLGARALYLGRTIYRVHGTNQPSTIGQFVSSGCIRMLNDDVIDLYSRVKVGTKVVVIGDGKGPQAPNTTAAR